MLLFAMFQYFGKLSIGILFWTSLKQNSVQVNEDYFFQNPPKKKVKTQILIAHLHFWIQVYFDYAQHEFFWFRYLN